MLNFRGKQEKRSQTVGGHAAAGGEDHGCWGGWRLVLSGWTCGFFQLSNRGATLIMTKVQPTGVRDQVPVGRRQWPNVLHLSIVSCQQTWHVMVPTVLHLYVHTRYHAVYTSFGRLDH